MHLIHVVGFGELVVAAVTALRLAPKSIFRAYRMAPPMNSQISPPQHKLRTMHCTVQHGTASSRRQRHTLCPVHTQPQTGVCCTMLK